MRTRRGSIGRMPTSETADAESHYSEQIFSCSMFSSPEDLYNHATATLTSMTSRQGPVIDQKLIYKNVPTKWAHNVLDQLDSNFEGCFRKHYNSGTSTIRISITPTRIHDCHQPWLHIQKGRWHNAGLITAAEYEFLNVWVGTTLEFIGGPYIGSIKEPDLFLQPGNKTMPSLTVESGWSESLPELRNDIGLWLVGGEGEVQVAIIISWEKIKGTNTVQGQVELYKLDRNGVPYKDQSFTIFPAPSPPQAAAEELVLTRKDLFGSLVFAGRNPNDQLCLSIDLLRKMATGAMELIDLVPA